MDIQEHKIVNEDNSYEILYYYKDVGKYYYHKEDGPAYIGYYPNGVLRIEVYWVNNQIHREDGPARITYNKKGEAVLTEYIIHGKYINYDEWQENYGWKVSLKGTPMGEIYGS